MKHLIILMDNDVDSIESIPFMAEPAKKKSTRTKKATA